MAAIPEGAESIHEVVAALIVTQLPGLMIIMMVTLIITDRMWRLQPPESATVLAAGQVGPLDRR